MGSDSRLTGRSAISRDTSPSDFFKMMLFFVSPPVALAPGILVIYQPVGVGIGPGNVCAHPRGPQHQIRPPDVATCYESRRVYLAQLKFSKSMLAYSSNPVCTCHAFEVYASQFAYVCHGPDIYGFFCGVVSYALLFTAISIIFLVTFAFIAF